MAGHHHHHHHHPRSDSGGAAGMGRALVIGIVLNVAFVIIELAAGFVAHSTALVADAVHNFGDVLGLVLAAIAARLATRKPSARRTYGLRRSTILASLANAVLLLVSVGAVSWEAIDRIRTPAEIRGGIVVALAAIGVLVNAGSALLLARGRKRDANVRGAYLHLIADAAVSLGVVIAGALMIFTGFSWLDPVASLVVSIVILVGTWSLLRESINLALDAVPERIDPDKVRSYLGTLTGVIDVHDLHIWAMSTTETALTAHLVMPGDSCHPAFLRDVGRELEEKFSIAHTTLQVEAPDAPDTCMHAPDDVV